MKSPWADLGPITPETNGPLTVKHYAELLQPCYERATWKLGTPTFTGRTLQTPDGPTKAMGDIVVAVPSVARIEALLTDLTSCAGLRRHDNVQCGGLRVTRTDEGGLFLQADEQLAAYYWGKS